MRLNKLTIENFRSYEEKTTFEFKGKKNINLIIGENGTGKTSFLSAIKYVLFGSRTFGSDTYTIDYVNWATNELNFNTKSNTFSISLQFVDKGNLIEVTRSSTIGSSYSEEVELFINGKRQPDTHYLETLNYNLFNNIFFNGEKISEVTSSPKEMIKFTENIIDVYFELDVFKQIIKDSQNAINKDVKKVSTDKYNLMQRNLKHLNQKIDGYEASLKTLSNSINNNELKINGLTAEMEKFQTLSNSQEKKLKLEIDKIKSEIDKIESKLRSFLSQSAFNLLSSDVVKSFNEELAGSRKVRKNKIIDVYEKLNSSELQELGADYIPPHIEARVIDIHSCNQKSNLEEIKSSFTTISKLRRNLSLKITELKKSEEGKQHISTQANLEYLKEEHTNLLENQKRITAKREEEEKKRIELIAEMNIESKNMLSDTLAANAIEEKEKLIEVCETYLATKQKDVFNQVAGHMETILKEDLLRKKNLVDSIVIDDYRLNIISNGKIRDLSSFSAGEQQMFLIALIFSILDQANVEVPLILDTFFARIDGTQQENLIKYIDNKLDSQALFISTDSELTLDKQKLFSNVNRKYTLLNEGYKTKVEANYAN